jgi:hypothetical protein
MVVEPVPEAVTIPALALGVPPELVLTGNADGNDEIQVVPGELVRSLTYGTVENVPIARNWPVSCRSPTESEAGMMVSESSGSGRVVVETVTGADVVTTVPSGLLNSTVIVAVPAPNP